MLYQPGAKGKKAKSRKTPWEMPERIRTYDTHAPNTLFGVKFLIVILDEAHSCRNPGNQHSAAISITQNAHSRLILTATPLQTRTEVSENRSFLPSTMSLNKRQDIGAMGRLCNIAYFFSEQYADDISADASDIRRAKADDEADIPRIQAEASRRMQAQFEGRLICRRASSLDDEGKPLLSLPPCKIIHAPVYPQDWELEYIEANMTDESMDV